MQRLQPHVKEIQKNHKDNKEDQAKALLRLYKEHKFNPFSGILLLFIQLPVFIALFQIFNNTEVLLGIFDNHTFLGLFGLDQKNFILVGLATLFQYWQGRLSLPPKSDNIAEKNSAAAFSRSMILMSPFITAIVLINLPSAIALYWTVSNLFSVFQQFIINKKLKDKDYGKHITKDQNSA